MLNNSKSFFRIVLFLFLAKSQLGENAEYGMMRNRRASGSHFDYSNPEEWGLDSPSCSGSRQSPIDINSNTVEELNDGVRSAPPLNWRGYKNMPSEMTLKNNGHSVMVSAIYDDDQAPCISGGVLDGDYTFSQLYFHWGSSDDTGSEHTMDGKASPLELHMVHYKTEYGSFGEALKKNDGLAVVGVLYQIDERKDGDGIAELQRQSSDIEDPNSEVKITQPFPLSDLNVNFQQYITYPGSITTPPCSEIVTWIVSAQMNVVSANQMDVFRNIQLAHHDDHNYRPTMPLNGRTVYYVAPNFF